jgi:pimeloyl-ACP methyl ester carboxylesterase
MAAARSITHRQIALCALGAALLAACGSKVPARVAIIDGREIEVAAAGEDNGATVVFEAGLGDDWTSWDEVASRVADHTRVFAYSRPGYGASSPATTERDPRTIVAELRSLLTSQGYVPPFVLVGHSNGGGYMELFARAHPDEVAGVVLVDPRHRDFLGRCEAAKLDVCGIPEAMLETQGASLVAEYRAYTRAAEEIRAAGEFGAYPVVVLTANDQEGSTARKALWVDLHDSLVAEAANGEHVIVHGATHYVQIDRPGKVVDAVVSVLAEVAP